MAEAGLHKRVLFVALVYTGYSSINSRNLDKQCRRTPNRPLKCPLETVSAFRASGVCQCLRRAPSSRSLIWQQFVCLSSDDSENGLRRIQPPTATVDSRPDTGRTHSANDQRSARTAIARLPDSGHWISSPKFTEFHNWFHNRIRSPLLILVRSFQTYISKQRQTSAGCLCVFSAAPR